MGSKGSRRAEGWGRQIRLYEVIYEEAKLTNGSYSAAAAILQLATSFTKVSFNCTLQRQLVLEI